MTNNALATLFHPFEQGVLVLPAAPFTAAFLNARAHPMLGQLGAKNLVLQQYFKPYATALQDEGFSVVSEPPMQHEPFDLSFVLLPKNADEARGLLAQALRITKPGGQVICAADNKAGGSRIKKMLEDFGVAEIQDLSKNKARVCWFTRGALDESAIEAALTTGGVQTIVFESSSSRKVRSTYPGFMPPDNVLAQTPDQVRGDKEKNMQCYVSMPGLFGWDKIDQGSEILVQHLPETLRGVGADFGCGYGYLSRSILQRCSGITELLCIDADYRAMKLCQQNLTGADTQAQLRFFWEDLTAPLPGHVDLDFIVMNPPFHEGKITDSDIGKGFIQTAAKSLSPGGTLWMVANAQLPYEEMLEKKFTRVEKLFEGRGFKVFCAVK